MANPNSLKNLAREKPRWFHLPTVAIRVPEVLSQQILDFARSLDQGKPVGEITRETVSQWIKSLDVEPLQLLEVELKSALIQAKERKCDRRLEQAVSYLASCCDGAFSQDGAGFNKADTGFGKWLSECISQKKTILKSHAQAALKMIQKYAKQLERGGLTLPEWEAIAHQYPDKIRLTTLAMVDGEEKPIIPDKRIQVVGDKIAVYAPYDSTGKFQREAKAIEGYKFEGSDKSWRYPLNKIEEVLAKFPKDIYQYDPNLEGAIALHELQKAEELARLEAEALEKSGGIIKLVQLADLDAPLSNGWYLRDYQKRGVEWLLAHRRDGIYKGGILADHMGLGKSLVALVAARAIERTLNCPVFVIAPVSLLDNWLREAERAEVMIETFSWAKMPKPLDTQKYVLICDESHYMQNIDSQRTKKALELAQNENCLAAWLLTGTPIKNGRPINLYPLLLAVDHPLAVNKWDYQKHYCNAHHKSVGYSKTVWDNTGASHLDELAKKTEDVILRRTKQECLTELPAKTRLFKQAELEPSKAKEYDLEIKRLVREYKDRAKAGLVDPDAEALVTLNYLRKVGSQFKVDPAIALAEELLEQGQQVVLFTEFLDSASRVYARLGGELLTGESKAGDRQAMIDRFQSGESKVFVGTIKAGGVGITLTAASHVILIDRPWTPGDCEQAEDRCHRLGQENAVFATWLQLGQIDYAIDSLLESKQQRIELVLKGKRKTLRGLDSPKELAKQLLEIL